MLISKPPHPITLTIEQAGHVFNQQRDFRRIGDLTGLVWVDHFETWLEFNRGLICVDRFSA
jgi:hypothetical protein